MTELRNDHTDIILQQFNELLEIQLLPTHLHDGSQHGESPLGDLGLQEAIFAYFSVLVPIDCIKEFPQPLQMEMFEYHFGLVGHETPIGQVFHPSNFPFLMARLYLFLDVEEIIHPGTNIYFLPEFLVFPA